MIIRVITAITMAPTTLSVTPLDPSAIPNSYYLTLYAAFSLHRGNKTTMCNICNSVKNKL
jgi:hypothetical protein